jgi:hypothetical protein
MPLLRNGKAKAACSTMAKTVAGRLATLTDENGVATNHAGNMTDEAASTGGTSATPTMAPAI